jgi:alkylation response protein AidB-like acyl-CoA dehydrogenase
VTEALAARFDGGVVLGFNVQADVAPQWLLLADANVRERFLPGVTAGDILACHCDTDLSSDEPAWAEEDGGDVVVHGRKGYVINGGIADLCFVSARLRGEPAIILIEKSRPSVRVLSTYNKLGTSTVDSALIEFDGVRVPGVQVISKFALSQIVHWNRVMSRLRFLIATAAAAMQEELIVHIRRYASRRQLGGRALLQWPVNQEILATGCGDLALMRAGLNRGIELLSDPVRSMPEIAQIKWFCVDKACSFAAACCDLEGGAGYMVTSRSLEAYRELRGFRMAGGSQTTMLTIANHSLACRAEMALRSDENVKRNVG